MHRPESSMLSVGSPIDFADERQKRSPRDFFMHDYEIRPFQPPDEAGLLETGQLVARADGGNPLSAATWSWAYAGNPAGQRIWVALAGDVVAALYATRPRRVIADGEQRVFAHVADAWVHPAHRGADLQVQVGAALLAATAGSTADLLAYGWLERELWAPSYRELRFELLRVQTELVCEVRPGSASLESAVQQVQDVQPDIRALYDRCARSFGVSHVRDEEFLRWSVLERPGRRFSLFALRGGGGDLLAHAVLLPGCAQGAAWIVDWLVPDDEPEAGRALLLALHQAAHGAGCTELRAMLPEWSPWYARFQAQGFLAHPSACRMAIRKNTPRHEVYWLRDNWWYQPLDVDAF